MEFKTSTKFLPTNEIEMKTFKMPQICRTDLLKDSDKNEP